LGDDFASIATEHAFGAPWRPRTSLKGFDARDAGTGYSSQVIITAIAIGLLSAYHFGLRAGVVTAGVTAVLLVAAMVMPGHALTIYGVVIVGVIGICVGGPRLSRDEARPVKRGLRTAIRLARRMVKRLRK